MSGPRGIILAINFEDFIIFPLILVLSFLSLRICYRKFKMKYMDYGDQCPNKDCIRCRRKITKDQLLARLKSFKSRKNVRNDELIRIEKSIVKSEKLQLLEVKPCNEQLPTVVLIDDLKPAKPFYPLGSFDSLKSFDDSITIFKKELKYALERDYLWSKNEVPSGSWKLFYFVNQGKIQEDNCKLCPKTTEIILRIPDFMKNCSLGNAAFSLLTPGSKIPIHTGPTNARLRCHVTIQPGSKCRINVGKEQEIYEEKKVILFDDSYPHSVEYNGKNDNIRAVLMIDMWHPNVTQTERDAILDLYTL